MQQYEQPTAASRTTQRANILRALNRQRAHSRPRAGEAGESSSAGNGASTGASGCDAGAGANISGVDEAGASGCGVGAGTCEIPGSSLTDNTDSDWDVIYGTESVDSSCELEEQDARLSHRRPLHARDLSELADVLPAHWSLRDAEDAREAALQHEGSVSQDQVKRLLALQERARQLDPRMTLLILDNDD